MKLTEEQLKQLKNLNDSKVNKILGVTTLEVGKWYKGTYGCKEWLLIYNDGKYCSGFWEGNYEENIWYFSPDGDIANNSAPATREEVEEALIKEAKKRGFKNVGDLSLILPDGRCFTRGYLNTCINEFVFYEETNTLYLDGVPVFEDGKWAEIIDDKTEIKNEIKKIEQQLKELRYKL